MTDNKAPSTHKAAESEKPSHVSNVAGTSNPVSGKHVSTAKDAEEKLANEHGAVTNPGDPGYEQKVVRDAGGYVNVAEQAQGDRRFAERAERDGSVPRSTADEMEAGRKALERRHGTGRKLDAADADEIRGAELAQRKGNTPQPLK